MNLVRLAVVRKGKGSPDAHGEPTIIGETVPAPGSAAPDTDLIRRMADEDDVDAFAILFERHRVSVYRAALALTGDHGASEEVVMDTFRRAYIHRHRLRTDVSPLPWLHRVALNLCYDALGRKRPMTAPLEPDVTEGMHDTAAGPPEQAEREELGRIVRDGIAALPEKYRSVVALYYLQRMSLQEVADTLEIQLGTVKSRLHYALRQLRQVLEDDRRFGGVYRPLDDETLERRIG